jgi:peptidoglycan/xylan/chitin deacetylase (PgdA/CDA1 family)
MARLTLHLPHAQGARILTYHEVLAGDQPCPNPFNQVSAGRLAAQVDRLLEAGYTLVTVSDLAAKLALPGQDLGRIVSLTFDDGLAEHSELVLPILGRRGVRATFYILTGRIGRYRGGGRGPGRHLTADEIVALESAGMEVGSHGRNHTALIRLGPGELRDEITGSRDDLARLLGSPPLSFSYPYGTPETYGPRAVEEVRAAGYSNAVCTTLGANRPGSPLHELRRIPAYDTDDPDLTLARARGAYDWAGRLQGMWLRLFPHHSSRKGSG